MEIDDRMVHLARNAMLVAGMEMGKDGDHWPVIKANIHAMMRDYEQLKIERAVQEQLREHVGKIIGDYEKLLVTCDDKTKERMTPHVRKMRELHEAMFSPLATSIHQATPHANDEDAEPGTYTPWQSSAKILKSLTEEVG